MITESEQAEALSHIYSGPVKKEETEEERKARHRIAVIKEIINTEKDYVRHLTILTEVQTGSFCSGLILSFANYPVEIYATVGRKWDANGSGQEYHLLQRPSHPRSKYPIVEFVASSQ